MAFNFIKSIFQAGDPKSLASGISASWTAGTAQTLYTVPAYANGAVLTAVVMRAPTGTQPATVAVTANVTTVFASISTTSVTATVGNYQPVPSGTTTTVVLVAGQTVTVTPASSSAGASMLFDLMGYEF